MTFKDKKTLGWILFKLKYGGSDFMETLAKYGLTGLPLLLTILAMTLDFINYADLFANAMNADGLEIRLITFGLVFVADGAPLAMAYIIGMKKKRWFHWVCCFVLFLAFAIVIGANYANRIALMETTFATQSLFDMGTTTYTPTIGDYGITIMIASEPLGTSVVVFVFGILNDADRAVYKVWERRQASLLYDLSKVKGILNALQSHGLTADISELVATLMARIDTLAEEEKIYAEHLIIGNGSMDAATIRDDMRKTT